MSKNTKHADCYASSMESCTILYFPVKITNLTENASEVGIWNSFDNSKMAVN